MGTCAEKSVARGRELSFSFAVRPHFWVSLGDEFIAASTAKKNCSRQYDEGQFVALFEASFGSVRLNETMAKRVRFFFRSWPTALYSSCNFFGPRGDVNREKGR